MTVAPNRATKMLARREVESVIPFQMLSVAANLCSFVITGENWWCDLDEVQSAITEIKHRFATE